MNKRLFAKTRAMGEILKILILTKTRGGFWIPAFAGMTGGRNLDALNPVVVNLFPAESRVGAQKDGAADAPIGKAKFALGRREAP